MVSTVAVDDGSCSLVHLTEATLVEPCPWHNGLPGHRLLKLLPSIPFLKLAAGPGQKASIKPKSLPMACLFKWCCSFFRLFGCVVEVFLPHISPVFVAGIFRGLESELLS